MALVTGLPNVFAAPGPASVDLNNAAKAIATQVGGSFYDEAAAAYVQTQGNLDSNNLAANPGFRNSQKQEGRSRFTMKALGTHRYWWDGTSVITSLAWEELMLFPPIGIDCFVEGVYLAPRIRSELRYRGTLDLYINGSIVASSASTAIATNIQDVLHVDVGMPLRAGDVMYLDVTSLEVALTVGSASVTGDVANFMATAHCTAAHVR